MELSLKEGKEIPNLSRDEADFCFKFLFKAGEGISEEEVASLYNTHQA